MKRVAVLLLAASALTACSSSSAPKTVAVTAARTYRLAGFAPSGALVAGKPQQISFVVDQPSGAPLTQYRTGPGPHTGVHLIIVRSDLGTMIHRHPPVGSDGGLTQAVTFPTPGRYRVVVDVYPKLSGPLRNFQLFRWIDVAGKSLSHPLPPFNPIVTVDGYRFVLHSKPHLRAIQAAFLTFKVTGPNGRPAHFVPWYGALAHAVFFRAGTLDYFHTHVCSPGAAGCTSILGGARVTGSSTRAGVLHVGVLVPVAGTWRLFLQTKVGSHVLTAPFTLQVR
jgi:hypothetical protein